jgi:hypothetical protein
VNNFTEQDIDNYHQYTKVLLARGTSGMKTREAMDATKLSSKDYFFVMDNLAALKKQVKKESSKYENTR